jgi:hypothetical protein
MISRGNRPLWLALPLCLSLLLGTGLPKPGQAQEPRSILSLDVDFIGGAVSYVRSREEPDAPYWGMEFGLGGPFWSRMLLAGRHFADEDGPSYEARDGAEDKHLIEGVHLALLRRRATDRSHWDLGIRASAFFHFDSSDDDPGIPLFVGGYTSLLLGNRWIKVGPELLLGLFAEPHSRGELGILLAPLTGRISMGW